MNSITPITPDTPVPASESPPPPANAPAAGRPDHSLASLLLIGLAAVALLYAVRWSVEEHEAVLHAWDFREVPPEETPWTFPELDAAQDGHGVLSLAAHSGPGPELDMALDTDAIGTLRIAIEILRAGDETPVPFALDWFWASADDVAKAEEEGGWPYAVDRSVPIRVLDRHAPEIHAAPLHRREAWGGTIARGMIALKFPPDEPGPFLVRTFRIELLE
jgi:hypothetical protein